MALQRPSKPDEGRGNLPNQNTRGSEAPSLGRGHYLQDIHAGLCIVAASGLCLDFYRSLEDNLENAFMKICCVRYVVSALVRNKLQNNLR